MNYRNHTEKHGQAKRNQTTTEYRTWKDMRRRCYSPNHPKFKDYGGRGIEVCERWRNSFLNFFTDMGFRPLKFTIERIDNDGNYEPSNCCWKSQADQHKNKRSNHIITINGEAKILSDWARVKGIPKNVISQRLRLGWTEEKSVITPYQKRSP